MRLLFVQREPGVHPSSACNLSRHHRDSDIKQIITINSKPCALEITTFHKPIHSQVKALSGLQPCSHHPSPTLSILKKEKKNTISRTIYGDYYSQETTPQVLSTMWYHHILTFVVEVALRIQAIFDNRNFQFALPPLLKR